jgi:6-phosphogluconate dehydrogenase
MKYKIDTAGLGVMRHNLAQNVEENGFPVEKDSCPGDGNLIGYF